MRFPPPRPVWLLALLVLLASPAAAKPKKADGEVEQLRQQVESLSAQNQRLKQQVQDLAFALDALRLAVSRIRGRLTELEQSGPSLPTVVATPSAPPALPKDDLDAVIADLEAAGFDSGALEIPAGEDPEEALSKGLDLTPTKDADTYESARAKAQAGRCAEAVPALARFVREHPSDRRVPEAFLLSGDCYVQQDELSLATLQYRRVCDVFPGDARAATALLGLVKTHAALGEQQEARQAREQLLSQYPNSPEAAAVRREGTGH